MLGQVEQPLELGEAAQAHAEAQRVVADLPGGGRPLVHQLGAVLQPRRVDVPQEGRDVLAGQRPGVGPDELLADETVLGEGDEQVWRVALHLADARPIAARLAHLGDPAEQRAGGVGLAGVLAAGVRRGLQRVQRGLRGGGRRERPPGRAPVVGELLGRGKGGTVARPAAKARGTFGSSTVMMTKSADRSQRTSSWTTARGRCPAG
ncbi:hypothetical protein AB0M95_11825 [Sphaerisporangium sp. NPDC051017]|uniref:hypothetical protein n=1 Tax=Sphaerisporangium sp. NPDC051017 TaxID=3154636 RepID=UPI0034155D0C